MSMPQPIDTGQSADLEEFRQANGRFGRQSHGIPDRYNSGMGTYEMASRQRGSFQYPEPGGFDGTLEDHLDFYMNIPIPEELVRKADEEYRTAYDRALKKADSEGYWAASNDPEIANNVRSFANPHEAGDYMKRMEKEWSQRYVDAEAERWPVGAKMSPFNVRAVLAIGQAVRMRTTIANEADKQRLLQNVHTWRDGSTETYEQVWERYRMGDWLRNAL